VSDCCLTPTQEFFSYNVYHGKNKLIFNEMMMMCPLDQHAELDFYSASSL